MAPEGPCSVGSFSVIVKLQSCEGSFPALGDTETEARKPELLGILECTVLVTGTGLVLGTGS